MLGGLEESFSQNLVKYANEGENMLKSFFSSLMLLLVVAGSVFIIQSKENNKHLASDKK